jgi:hypothetical protein
MKRNMKTAARPNGTQLGNGFVKLGSALGKLASQIGDNPLRVGQRTV